MKKTTTWLVASTTENGKHSAFALPVGGCDNLCSVLSGIAGLTAANICASQKDAREIADEWNECFKRNGTYLYG